MLYNLPARLLHLLIKFIRFNYPFFTKNPIFPKIFPNLIINILSNHGVILSYLTMHINQTNQLIKNISKLFLLFLLLLILFFLIFSFSFFQLMIFKNR